jgi:hypothetical protein
MARLAASSTSDRTCWLSPDGQAKSRRRYPGLLYEAALQGGRTEHLAQRRVHHVGAGVGLAGPQPPLTVHRGQHVAPVTSAPAATLTLCTISPLTGRCTSSTSSETPSPVISPASESWPPDSA